MDLIEKLKSYKEKINNSQILNKELKELISIKLFDFITKENQILKKEFFRRFDYLKNLAEDKSFIKLQDDLFDTIVKILKTTSIENIKDLQKNFNNSYVNRLNIKKDYLTIPKLYLALQNKDNYYRLKYRDNDYFSPFDGEISIFTHIIPIKKQYTLIETFLDTVAFDIEEKNKTHKELDGNLQKFKDLLWRLNEKSYREPTKLDTKQFEDFFIFCARTSEQKGHEYWHIPDEDNFFPKDNDKKLEEIKNITSTVIDDLIESISPHKIQIIDYNDSAERKACEKKWDVLQVIWTIYNSNNQQPNIEIPTQKLIIKERTITEIDGIISGLQKDGCFKKWNKNEEIYTIETINETQLIQTFHETKISYKEFVANHQNQKENKSINYLVRKDSAGDYFYKDQKIDMNKETLYYKIFDVLFQNRDQSGFLSYKEIQAKINTFTQDNDKIKKKQISNALDNLFQSAKINNKKLKNKTPDCKKLIEKIRGKGLKLNNPQI